MEDVEEDDDKEDLAEVAFNCPGDCCAGSTATESVGQLRESDSDVERRKE